MENKYKQIKEAQKILQLDDTATLKEIKNRFYQLCHRWHPDKCKRSEKKSNDMIRKIKKAYDIIMDYCNNYRYSFEDYELKKYITNEEFWEMRFGDDWLYSNKH